jgi:hypothetical protein
MGVGAIDPCWMAQVRDAGSDFPGEVSPAHIRSSFSASQPGRAEGVFSCEVGRAEGAKPG